MSIHEADDLCLAAILGSLCIGILDIPVFFGTWEEHCKVPDLFRMPALKHEAELEEV